MKKSFITLWPELMILVLIAYVDKPRLNTHADESNMAGILYIYFSLSIHLPP